MKTTAFSLELILISTIIRQTKKHGRDMPMLFIFISPQKILPHFTFTTPVSSFYDSLHP